MSRANEGTRTMNLHAERAVLGACLSDPENAVPVVEAHLRAEHFCRPAHQEIWRALVSLNARGELITIPLVVDCLTGRRRLKDVGGEEYIEKLARETPTAAAAERHALLVRECALRALLAREAGHLVEQAAQGSLTAEELTDYAQRKIHLLAREVESVAFRAIEAAVDPAIQAIWTGCATIPTGFRGLDRIIGGWQKGEFHVLGAGTGEGKTALMSMAAVYAAEDDIPVLFIELEMDARQLVHRMIAAHGEVNVAAIIRSEAEDRDPAIHPHAGKIRQVGDHIRRLPIDIYDVAHGGNTIAQIRSAIRSWVRKNGSGLVIIDHIQLVRDPEVREGKVEEVASVSRALRLLASELDIALVALSQLNRENRNEKRDPRMEDLNWSSSLEKDASVVLLLHRPAAYATFQQGKYTGDRAELSVAKQRNGPTGMITLEFMGHHCRFVEKSNDRSSAHDSTRVQASPGAQPGTSGDLFDPDGDPG